MVGEITSEILFEAHAAVFEQAVHEIASDMNVSLKAVALVHRDTLATTFHVLHYKTEKGKRAGILIDDNEVANIPKWPLPTAIIESITSSISSAIQN